MPAVTCPTCDSDDIDAIGKSPSGDLQLKCEACGGEWTRTPNRPCPKCHSIDVAHTEQAGYVCRGCRHEWRDVPIAVAPPPPVKAAARPRTPRAATGTPTRVAATSGAARHIDDVWSAIVANEGATFTVRQGQAFSYQVAGDLLIPSTTNWEIPRSEVHEALRRMPVAGPAALKDLQAAAFLYAIVTDPRITPAWR
jgi:hypothetical protein